MPAIAKLDVGKALKLRLFHRLPQPAIARQFGCSVQAVDQALKAFKPFFEQPLDIQAYRDCRIDLFTHTEQVLLASLLDPVKLQKASLNNVAYAFQQIHTARRLEEGKTTENVGLLARLMDDAHKSLFERQAKSEPQVEACGQDGVMRINKPKTRKRQASPVVSHSQDGSES